MDPGNARVSDRAAAAGAAAARFVQRTKVTILTYHSVSRDVDPEACLALAGMRVSADRFAAQMEYVAAHYTVIPLSRYVAVLEGDASLPRSPCVVTFDDGYSDIYENAVPVLRRLRIPASIFVIGSLIAGGESWLHETYDILDSVTLADACEAFGTALGTPLETTAPKRTVRQRLRHALGSLDATKRTEVLAGARAGLASHEIRRTAFMGPGELRELHDEGFEIGSHSMSHSVMTNVSDVELDREVEDSRDAVRAVIGTPPQAFCYPFGGQADHDERTRAAVRVAGYRCALTTVDGFNGSAADPYRLRRIDVSGVDSVRSLMWRVAGSRSARAAVGRTVRKLAKPAGTGRSRGPASEILTSSPNPNTIHLEDRHP